MSMADRLDQDRREYAAMRQDAENTRATLAEIQEAGTGLRDELHRFTTGARRGLLVIAFLLGALTSRACSTFLGI